MFTSSYEDFEPMVPSTYRGMDFADASWPYRPVSYLGLPQSQPHSPSLPAGARRLGPGTLRPREMTESSALFRHSLSAQPARKPAPHRHSAAALSRHHQARNTSIRV